MEQSTSSSRSRTESYLPTLIGPKEIEVSQILLDIPNLIRREFPSQFHVIWGGKRKRSAIDLSPSQGEEERETEKRPKIKVEASSPTTPFSFSPTEESDEKSKLSLKKSSAKTAREERLEMIDELTQHRELLKGENEAVKSYYNKLKAINSDLKEKKREMEMCKKFGVELGKFNMVENQDYFNYMLHQQPSNVDQTVYGSQPSEKYQQYPWGKISPFFSCGSGSGKVKRTGPFCIPDLNESAEETFGVDSWQPLDSSRALVVAVGDHKAKSAEARRRRMSKMKEELFCLYQITQV